MSDQTRFILNETDLPKIWYNIKADSPVPPTPVLNPMTKEPITPDFLSVLFPMETHHAGNQHRALSSRSRRKCARSTSSTVPPRSSAPARLEKALGTPAHIYYKNEGVSPVGSHKPNTAIPQAFYNKVAGTKALTTETGAGQWGTALAMACNFFGIDLEVYMVKVSYNQKPYRRIFMETYGAQVFRQPHRPHRLRALPAGPGSRQQRLAGHRHLGSGGSGRHFGRGPRNTASARC